MNSYEKKKARFDNMMTLYGRKPVLEVLADDRIDVYRLHMANSNNDDGIIGDIGRLASQRGVEIVSHTRESLSRISKNRRQDQGVAVDIQPSGYAALAELPAAPQTLLGLDGITNPQNLGMIIRSVAASPLDGLLLPKKGSARIDALVHKASAGTVFHAKIYHAQTLLKGLKQLKQAQFEIIGLSGNAGVDLTEVEAPADRSRIFLLGNETEGLSREAADLCDRLVSIQMANAVESINVAAAATLVAFHSLFRR